MPEPANHGRKTRSRCRLDREQHAPATFVIAADDDVQWARGLRDDVLARAVSGATINADFVRGNTRHKPAYAHAVANAGQAGCEADERDHRRRVSLIARAVSTLAFSLGMPLAATRWKTRARGS